MMTGVNLVHVAYRGGAPALIDLLGGQGNASNYGFKEMPTICGLSRFMEVHPSIPANTVPEFIAHAKANPGKINSSKLPDAFDRAISILSGSGSMPTTHPDGPTILPT